MWAPPSGDRSGAISSSAPGRRLAQKPAARRIRRASSFCCRSIKAPCAMLKAMGKRGQDHETDAELWARVAGSARPLHKRPTVRKVDLPKPAPKAETKERPPAVK